MTLDLLRHLYLALLALGLTAAVLLLLDVHPIDAYRSWRESRQFIEHAVLCRRCFVTTMAQPKLPDKYLCPEGRAIVGSFDQNAPVN